jgi:hypothetical protein
MNECAPIINRFQTISLESLDSLKNDVKLMDRHDTKYVMPRNKLANLLELLLTDYQLLTVENKKVFTYKNLYFDTPDFTFYHQHHNQKCNRYKMRARQYVESALNFWEVKFKSNKGKTIKKRVKQKEFTTEITQEINDKTQVFLNKTSSMTIDDVEPKLWITFTRLTLASLERKERLTFDVDITYTNIKDEQICLSDIAIAELKQPSLSLRSPFAQISKKERIYPRKFSKYCTGVSLLHDVTKKGRFKRRLMYLDKISGGHTCFSKT